MYDVVGRKLLKAKWHSFQLQEQLLVAYGKEEAQRGVSEYTFINPEEKGAIFQSI
jgi:hypothetical protein